MNKKPDGRKNNGGHATGGRKKLADADQKKQVAIYLSENEYKKSNWKSVVCDQFKEKFENKLKNIC